jgi:hypothetical protein
VPSAEVMLVGGCGGVMGSRKVFSLGDQKNEPHLREQKCLWSWDRQRGDLRISWESIQEQESLTSSRVFPLLP